MITQERLKQLLHYCPEAGNFTSLRSRRKDGANLGGRYKNKSGKQYRRIKLDGKHYLAHRLAFLYVEGEFPPEDVDHIDGDGQNNRWSNLRHVTPVENNRNKRTPSNNTSGVIGVSWQSATSKWKVGITVRGRQIFLGYSDNIFDAAATRLSASVYYGFHENHGSNRPL